MPQGIQNKLREFFSNTDCGALLIKLTEDLRDLNFYYFTQLPKTVFGHIYFIAKPGTRCIYASVLEFDAIKNELKQPNIELKLYSSEKNLIEQLQHELSSCKKIGINFSGLSHTDYGRILKQFPEKEFLNVSQILNKLRETKTEDELHLLKNSVKITEKIAEGEFLKKIKPGLKEIELKKSIEDLMRSHSVLPSFDTIVASGINGRIPHHISGEKKLKKGELLLIDFGVEYKNYCSDLSRTFVLGRANAEQKKLYGIVYSAQQNSIEKAVAGNQAKELYLASENFLKQHGFSMIHSIGHGLGLKVHDFPSRMREDSDWQLQENNVLTIEPGIYSIKFGGIRIEDDVVITKGKPLMLSRAPGELMEI